MPIHEAAMLEERRQKIYCIRIIILCKAVHFIIKNNKTNIQMSVSAVDEKSLISALRKTCMSSFSSITTSKAIGQV